MGVGARLDRPIGGYGDHESLPDWALGPFKRDDEPALEPTNRGWESGRIFNMSVIEEDGRLFLFYRATPDDRIDQDSRIGLAWSDDGETFTRHDENPILEPTEPYEHRGCEDPKVYRHGDTYYLFYNPIWEAEGVWGNNGEFRCNICVATSPDLIHWEKHGQLVPARLSDGWAKGAVIPHNPRGEPVKIDGEFMMFVGELDGDGQLVGYSDDLLNWDFHQQRFLDPMPEQGVEAIHEPATMLTGVSGREDDMFLTFNYVPSADLRDELHLSNLRGEQVPPSGQALYSRENPTEPVDFAPEPAGSWGGIISFDGEWLFPDQECACFARAPITDSE